MRTKRRRSAEREQDLRDASLLGKALSEARRGRRSAWPNPMVGAIVVQGTRQVGRGYHRRPGEAHAEIKALERAGKRARGATLYLNLEPCSHHGRTPPCVDAVIEAQIARVVFSQYDPNPRVAGRGARRLLDAGIEVRAGLLGDRARRLNEVFIGTITQGRPFVTLKSASTLDGAVATRTGHSQWITGPAARKRVHSLRRDHGAVLVGVGTVLADDPSLTVRAVPGPSPLRIVLDSHLRTPPGAKLATDLARGTVFACLEDVDQAKSNELEASGATIWGLPGGADGRVDLEALLQRAAGEEISSILVEGGAAVFSAFLEAGLADKLCAFVAPRILGGGRPLVGDFGYRRIDEALSLHGVRVRGVGGDCLIDGYFDPYFDSDPADPAACPRGAAVEG